MPIATATGRLGFGFVRHHEDAVAAFVRAQAVRPDTLGVIIVGSVARGDERPDSDVDVYLVVTDQAYGRAAAEGIVAMVSTDGADYEGGYIDIKLASPAYLTRAVEAADDPTRASMLGARVVLDRLGGLAELAVSITRLPEAVWQDRLVAYRAQVELYGGYFLPQGAERGDVFLLQHASVHACLAAGRLALAHHRRLFAGQKYLARDLAGLDRLPGGFLTVWHGLLANPTPVAAGQLRDIINKWLGPAPDADRTLSRFIADNEQGWLTGAHPPEFW